MDIREVLVEWNSPGSPGGTSVLYFDTAQSIALDRNALRVFLDSYVTNLAVTGTSYTIATSGKVLDDQNGNLLGPWSDTTVYSNNGTRTSEAVPNASQVLVRWGTLFISRNRMVKGRMNLPGLSSEFLIDGELDPGAASGLNTAISAFLAGSGLRVWQRPTPAQAGTAALALTGSVWSELAVLRRRRN